jgi:hypothetical protein
MIAIHYSRSGQTRFNSADRLIRSLNHRNSSALVKIEGVPSVVQNDGDRITSAPMPTRTFRDRQVCAELSAQLAELPQEVRSILS